MVNKYNQNTIIRTDVAISVSSTGEKEVCGNHIADARIGVEERDPTVIAVIAQLGLKPDTPPALIEQLLKVARAPGASAQIVEQEAKKMGLGDWLGTASNLASVVGLVLQMLPGS